MVVVGELDDGRSTTDRAEATQLGGAVAVAKHAQERWVGPVPGIDMAVPRTLEIDAEKPKRLRQCEHPVTIDNAHGAVAVLERIAKFRVTNDGASKDLVQEVVKKWLHGCIVAALAGSKVT